MNRPAKTAVLACVLVALALLLLGGCGDEKAAAPTPGVYRSPRGLEVAVRDVQPDETAQIFDIHRWRFAVKPPEGKHRISYTIALRTPGQQPVTVAGFALTPDGPFDGDTLVALCPSDTSVLAAGKLRFYIRSGGAVSTGTIDNPALDFRSVAPVTPARVADDGSFELMRFSHEGAIPTDENTVLLLKVEAEKL